MELSRGIGIGALIIGCDSLTVSRGVLVCYNTPANANIINGLSA
jgi:hypothetical protein